MASQPSPPPRRKRRRRVNQRTLDRWFPTVVRYGGIALMVYCAIVRQPALMAAATGMILFKTVVGDGTKD